MKLFIVFLVLAAVGYAQQVGTFTDIGVLLTQEKAGTVMVEWNLEADAAWVQIGGELGAGALMRDGGPIDQKWNRAALWAEVGLRPEPWRGFSIGLRGKIDRQSVDEYPRAVTPEVWLFTRVGRGLR